MTATSPRSAHARERARAAFGGRLSRADRSVLAVLVVLPLLIFALPAFFNHSILPGDDFTQNYPLRAFVGSQIRHGHLPLYNPYIWSGAPLLGGWNAGAAYPFTLLFVVFPATAAWAMNLVATWWVAGFGAFAFLRASRLSPVPSFLGSLSFAFAGAMTAQVVHIGLVAGMSWIPLALLAILRLSETRGWRSSTTTQRGLRSSFVWMAVLAVAMAMTVLAGEPRAIANAVIVMGIYGLWRTIRLGREALPFLALAAGSLVLAACLGAVQWLTGIHAVTSSQRAANSYYLFTSGSLPLRWLSLLVVPDLLGGSGSFGQPPFLASYNLTEIAGYVGLMPLAAALALLGTLRRRRPLPEWIVWHVVALVGILFTLGSSTPLWHLLIHLPLFSSQRLQSRNLLVADLGLAFLLAYWSESWLARRKGGREPRTVAVLGAIPGLVCIGTVVVGIAWGAGLLHWLGVGLRAADQDGGLRMWFLPFAVLGAASVALVVAGTRLTPRRRAQALVTFVVVDIVTFSFLSIIAVASGIGQPSTVPASAGATPAAGGPGQGETSVSQSSQVTPSPGASVPNPPTDLPASAFSGNGRFAIYDPGLIDNNGLDALGAPDLNVVDAVPSVQGYSSIVDGTYATVTGTHQATGLGQNVLDPAALTDGTFDQLDTKVLFAPRNYLIVSEPTDDAAPDPAAGTRDLSPGGRATWYLGVNLLVRSVSVPDAAAADDLARGLRLGLAAPGGRVVFQPASTTDGKSITFSLERPTAAVAVVVDAGNTRTRLGPPSITSADGTRYTAAGQLQGALVPPHWTLRGFNGSFAIFANRFARPGLSLRPLPGSGVGVGVGHDRRTPTPAGNQSSTTNGSSPGVPGASVRAIAGSPFSPSAAAVSSPNGVEIVRSVSAIPGWRATWRPTVGHAVALPVRRAGLVQRVDVPAGRGVLAWAYDPPGWRTGWKLTIGGLVVLALIVALTAARSAVTTARRAVTGARGSVTGARRSRDSTMDRSAEPRTTLAPRDPVRERLGSGSEE